METGEGGDVGTVGEEGSLWFCFPVGWDQHALVSQRSACLLAQPWKRGALPFGTLCLNSVCVPDAHSPDLPVHSTSRLPPTTIM